MLLLLWNAAPQLVPAFRENWYTPFVAAVIGLALTEAAFMSEIIRSALQSVDEGQSLAARALGMKPLAVLFKVTLPQAIRVAIPPTGNEFIAMVKYSSLASVISLRELSPPRSSACRRPSATRSTTPRRPCTTWSSSRS